MGFNHVHSPDDLNHMLISQGCILETALTVRIVGRMYIPRTGEGWGASEGPRSALRSTSCHGLSMTFSNTCVPLATGALSYISDCALQWHCHVWGWAWLPCCLGCARALITPGATVARSTETEDQIMQDWCHDRYQYQRHSRPGHVDVKSRFNFIYTNVKCDMSYTASVVKRLAYFLFVSHGARQIIYSSSLMRELFSLSHFIGEKTDA